jgi:Zn-dependent protease
MVRYPAGGLRLGTVASIEIVIDWSLLVIFALVFSTLSLVVFPQWHPDWGQPQAMGLGLMAAVLFFASILVHELSHALVGRMHGVVIRRITLFMFGGMAQMENEPRTWRGELVMALAGPLASLAIGISLLAFAVPVSGALLLDADDPQRWMAQLDSLATLFLWLGSVNVMIGLFNLIPGFPMDGGRVLRAALWALSGDLRSATRWASRAGQGFAWVLITAGLLMMIGLHVPVLGGGFFNGLWLVMIGWFLYNAAVTSYQQLRIHLLLQSVMAGQLMRPAPAAVGPDLPVSVLLERTLRPGAARAFPVEQDGELLGMVCLSDLGKHPRQDWEHITVGQVMTPRHALVALLPGTDAATALALLARHGFNQLPVIEQGRMQGLVRREDVLAWLSRRIGPGRGDLAG